MNASRSDDEAYETFKKVMQQLNRSGSIKPYGAGPDEDGDYPELQGKDSVPIVIILGAFFSICAAISLIVLLIVYCSQNRGRWPFRRRPGDKATNVEAAEVNGEQQALWNQTAAQQTETRSRDPSEERVLLVNEPPTSQHHSSSSSETGQDGSGPAKVKTKVPTVAPDEQTQDSIMVELKQKQQESASPTTAP